MNNQSLLFRLGLFSYLALMLLALVYFQERTLWGDIAFHIFSIIKNDGFAIQNGRSVAFMTQLAPYISSQLGLSFKSIALSYSLIFVVYYGSIYWLSFKIFNNVKAALSMLLLSMLMVCDTFFWIQSELPQGLAMMMLALAILTKSSQISDYNKLELFFLAGLLLLVVYAHPLMIFPFSFIGLFLFLSQEKTVPTKVLIGAFLFFMVVVFLKQTVLKLPSSYEDNAMARLNNFKTLFPNYLTLDYNVIFFKACLKKYYFLLLLLMLMSYFYVQQQKRLKLGLIWTFFLGYLLLINVVQTSMRFEASYLENLYLPLSVFVTIPFVYDFLPHQKKQHQLLLLGLIIGSCLIRIVFFSSTYSDKLAWQKDLLTETEHWTQQKLVVPLEVVPQELNWTNAWSSPYEFWLISGIQNPNNLRSVIIHPNPTQLKYQTINQAFITDLGTVKYTTLQSKQYFNFQDSSFYTLYQPSK